MQQPFFSIVSPMYNRAETIGRAIESVLKQSFTSWELILIDDGSTDNTNEIVAAYADPRIHYEYQENQERSASRNKAIGMAKGAFICFLDSDDYYLENHLEVLHRFIQEKGSQKALYYTGGYKQRAKDILAPNPLYSIQNYKHPIDYILRHCLLINSVCVQKDIFSTHYFNPAYNSWEDTELWIRVTAVYPFFFIPEYTTVASREADPLSGSQQTYTRYHPRDWNWKLAGLKSTTLNHTSVVSAMGRPYLANYLSAWFFEFTISQVYRKNLAGALKAYSIAWKNNRTIVLSKKTFSLFKALALSVIKPANKL